MSNSPDDFVNAVEAGRKDPSKRGIQMPEDFASRPYGLIMLALAGAGFYFDTWSAMQEAAAGAAMVHYSGKFTFIQPLLAVMGLIYTLFGASASKVLGPTTKPSLRGWALIVACVALCVWYISAVEHYLSVRGYDV